MPQQVARAKPAGHLRLEFGDDAPFAKARGFSAVEQVGDSLWLAGDEAWWLDRLVTSDYSEYRQHKAFALDDFFVLPSGQGQEIDIEGMGVDHERGRLWLAGSHSLRRRQPGPSEGPEKMAAALATMDRQANRYLLGYVELETGGRPPHPRPVGTGRALRFDAHGSGLVTILADSPLLAPFLSIPSKDNGFDIEGLAVDGDTVFLGLRGPVLRGWASILQLRTGPKDDGLDVLPDGDHATIHHLLDLGGLGIRDLCILGADMLVLAGPTMMLDGPIKLFRWHDAVGASSARRVDGKALQFLYDIPWGFGRDHAEGIALFRAPGEHPRLLVVYDSPAKGRLHHGRYFEADLFDI